MAKAQKSIFKPKNPEKYVNPKRLNDLICRSSWERQVAKWCDYNENVIEWGLEEVIIPYISKVDLRQHKYYMDFYIKFKNGNIYLVEVKPKNQTQPPDKTKIKSKKKLIAETTTFARNVSKWEAAKIYAQDRNIKFVIWTEIELNKMGLHTNTSKPFKAIKYKRPIGKIQTKKTINKLKTKKAIGKFGYAEKK